MITSASESKNYLEALQNREKNYQNETLSLVASDNYASSYVLSQMNSAFNNKCSESYPGSRKYSGLAAYDELERFATMLCRKLFGVNYANVQAYSGSNANLAAMSIFLRPGDRFMGLSIDSGGHYSHGFGKNISGQFFEPLTYGADESDHFLNYDLIREAAISLQPKLIFCGASYYPRIIDFEKFRRIADEVGAALIADISHISGLILANLHPSPVAFADIITSTTHKILRGPRGALMMSNKDLSSEIDKSVFPFLQGSCHMHQIAGIAACLDEASTDSYSAYVIRVNELAQELARQLILRQIPVLTGGTDTHMVIVKVKDAEETLSRLESINILASPVKIMNDANYVRFGTCAMASRNINIEQIQAIAPLLAEAILSDEFSATKKGKEIIWEITNNYPVIADYLN